jgi:ribonuclease G
MSKEMIISVNGREKKIAILDNGKVTEFYIERGEENTGIAGNIYKGRVQRVLPGMQSAFVSIGLERDAFLYVSDFFDEEEEIERIVMEKSKKISPEDAKREANEKIDRSRIEREKAMESAQEIAEPIVESGETLAEEPVAEDSRESARRGRGRRGGRDRDRKERSEEQPAAAEPAEQELGAAEPPPIEFDDSGFERISDDEDTGDMFKDAYMQEMIVDQVRAIEFDMEDSTEAEVGSLLSSVTGSEGGFERIADEDEEDTGKKPKAKSTRSRSKKSAEGVTEESEKSTKKKSTRAKAEPKPRAAKSKKPAGKAKQAAASEGSDGENSELTDAEATVREPDETAAMAVRRGGRGRRRGGKGRKKGNGDALGEGAEGDESDEEPIEGGSDEALEAAEVGEPVEPVAEPEMVSENEIVEAIDEQPKESVAAEGERERGRGSRDNRGRDKRRDNRGDGDGSRDNRPADNRTADNRDTRGGDSGPRDNRGRDNQRDGGKRFDRNDRNDRGRDRTPQPTISDLLREGQEILVQIAKEPIAKKGARITSHIALPGRFLVYMPTIEHVGVSRKIESASERGRLRTLIQRIRAEEDVPSGGFIVRTAGIGISEEDLRQDARYLVRTWIEIKKTSEKAKSPAMVHQDLDLVQRLLRDQLSDEFSAIRVDSEEEYLRTVEFINRIQPRLVNRVKLYTREDPILETYAVQEEIDKALKPRVWLKSGGYLVLNQTEALVAIDVNTGKFVGKGNARLEDTITRTNMEAVDEIARQIRLRDLGGIIVLDLIDMEDRRNRHKVSQALQEALAADKSPTKVLSFNDFGLIIMTRKRVKQSLERTMCSPCEYCEGAGWVKSPTTVCYEILSEARRLSKHQDDVRQTTLRIHPDVAKALRSTERLVLEEIEEYLGNVDVTADPHIHQAQYDFAFV